MNGVPPNSNSSWRKKYRLQVQLVALILAVTASFGLYTAAQNGDSFWSGAWLATLALSMLLTGLVG
ncbi:MAG TPA: hypothetical protein DEQ80_11200 [Anaerolinea thermolimosa]|uniref:Uncharacterized protein n=1 Tax=Anaerolinea thermolimosa TaxID=229919 RepID=A0A3D1JL87_9CHLR|nr:hypothetical protein [Anaerolinea thermolimosa]GAP05220.1 hypothetical protein ATHL_00050 [Anaerolinea thermolimosa]HCE18416.1 hypothetical protein [Anaerolinea thermolimosa]